MSKKRRGRDVPGVKPKQKKFYEWIDQRFFIFGTIPFDLYRLYLAIKTNILFSFIETDMLLYIDDDARGNEMEVSYKHGIGKILGSTPLNTTEYIKFTHYPSANKVIIEYHYYKKIIHS